MKRDGRHLKKIRLRVKCSMFHMGGDKKETCNLPPPLTQDAY